IVINAHAGIEVNTRRVFLEAGKLGVGRILVINKMDTDNIDFPRLIDSIREVFGTSCVPFHLPIGQGHDFRGVVEVLDTNADKTHPLLNPHEIRERLVETIVEVDEVALERYFAGTAPTDEDLNRLLVQAVAAGNLIPIACCAGKSGIGVAELLTVLARCAVPAEKGQRLIDALERTNGAPPDPNGPIVAQVFKTRIDPFVQKLSYVRVYSGTLHKDAQVHASSARKNIKIGPLLEVQGAETSPIAEAGPGMIVAISKMEDLHTGTTLGDQALPDIQFPTPMVGLAVVPKTRGDETKLSGALHKIEEEDPTLHLDRDPQTKELVMMGMSDLHLGILRERLRRRDKLEVEVKEPKIPYRETVQTLAEGMYRHKKQSGGRGQFGEVHIRLRPLPRNTDIPAFATKANFPQIKEFHYDPTANFLWVDSVVGGTIPGNFLPAIEKGFQERLARGVIAGYQIQDVCVEVHYGKHHPVDSSEAAFRIAASCAFRDVFLQAQPCLLEPITKISITVPVGNVGDVYSDLSARRGRVLGSDSAGGNLQTVHALVPLAEVTNYARSLLSMTGGQGTYSLEFSHRDVVPANVQHEVVSHANLNHEEED
ncbi:MAG: elongation factor G, partial [Planctomycetota bacterium]|nr:elongation factor G [Planctomycetota bacterium]